MIEKLLSKLSKDELAALLGDDEEEEEEQEPLGRHTINPKRRGRGHAKANRNKSGRDTTKKRNKKSKGRTKKDKPCRVLPFDTSTKRRNNFNKFIKDVHLDEEEQTEMGFAEKMDKNKGKKHRAKPPRQSSVIEVMCSVCKDYFDVPAALVVNEKRWRCNDCSCGPRG